MLLLRCSPVIAEYTTLVLEDKVWLTSRSSQYEASPFTLEVKNGTLLEAHNMKLPLSHLGAKLSTLVD